MIRAFRRRVTVYRIYRQNRALWDTYLFALGSSASAISSEALSALDKFLLDFLSSYDKLSQPKLLHRLFGETFLPAVLDALIKLITEDGSVLVKQGCDGLNVSDTREIIERALTVCSIILQDPVHSSQVAFNLPLASKILSLLETIEDKELKTLVLQLISGLCYNHESRLEIARLDGFRKILGLLNHGDEALSHQILRTLQVFLDAESDNQNIFSGRGSFSEVASASYKSFSSSKITSASIPSGHLTFEKAGTWSKLRSSFPDKKPSITRSKSLINLNITDFVSLPTEFGLFSAQNSETYTCPEEVDRPSSTQEDAMVPLQSDIIRKHIQQFSELHYSTLSSTTSIVKSLLTTQGALEQLSRSLQESQLEMQLELLQTISTLMLRDYASQREFARIKGYSSITRLLLQAVHELPDSELQSFLEECFSNISKIILDGSSQLLVSNMSAFSWLMTEISPSGMLIHSPVFAQVVDFLNGILTGNPINAAAFVDYIPSLLSSYNLSNQSASRSIERLLLNLDILLSSYKSDVLDGFIQLWTPTFDGGLVECTMKLIQHRIVNRAPRSSETIHLITIIGRQLNDDCLLVQQRYSLVQLLILAALCGESYSLSLDSDPELSPACVDLEEAMDILYTSVISMWPEHELALHFLGLLTSIWSTWSELNSARLGHHADSQSGNSGLRLLLRLFEVANVDVVPVLSVISSILIGFYGNEDFSRFQREFASLSGFRVLISALLSRSNNMKTLQSGVFALLAAVVNSPSNKIDLECEPKFSELSDVLVACEKTASFETNLFNFFFELATENEIDAKCDSLVLPDFMMPSTLVLKAVFSLVNWRKAYLVSHSSMDVIVSLCKDFGDSFSLIADSSESNTELLQTANNERVTRSTSRQLRSGSPIPLQCLKLCVYTSTASTQASMLAAILHLVKGRPHNKLILTEIDALSFLIRMWQRFVLNHSGVRDTFFALLSCLGRYSLRPNQTRLLFDLAYHAMSLNDASTESYILDVVADVAARITPESYFSFNMPTTTASSLVTLTFTRTPVSRTGYSVVFWFKISQFINEETSLFTWTQNEVPLYEVLLRLTPRPTGDNYRSVCIRCLNSGTFMFDKKDTMTANEWHHLVLNHNRSGVAIMVDSVLIGKYPAVPYPSTLIKRDLFQLIVGGPNFVGQIGNIHVLEGCMDNLQAQFYFSQGPSAGNSFPDSKLLLKVHAEYFVESACRVRMSSTAALTSRTLSGSSIQSESRLSLPSNVDAHHTISFRKAFGSPDVGGFSVCIPFIGENRPDSSGARLTALRILAGLILQSTDAMVDFERQNGFEMLSYCLTPGHLSMDVFDVLFEIARKNISCLTLIMDLLRHSTGPGTRCRVMGIIADMVRDESLPYFNSTGLINLLQVLSIAVENDETVLSADGITSSPALLSSVLAILEQVIMTCSGTAEFEVIIAFIVCKHEQNELLSEERAAITALFCSCSEKRESLLGSVSFHLVIRMLESNSANVRIQCLRLLALLLRNSSKNKSAFVKMHGFDVILRLLAKHQPVNESICDAIFDLALDRYNAPLKSNSRPEDRPNAIVHPEAIRLLLELLRLASSRPTLHLRYIERLDELIESNANLNILLAEPWLHWCRQYLEGIGRFHSIDRPHAVGQLSQLDPSCINDTDSISTSSVLSSTRGENGEKHRARLISRFVRLIQKIAIRDLSLHTGRTSCLPTLALMVEASEFVSLVVDRILHYFEKHPRLDEYNASCLVRNLARIIESIDELCGAGDKPISGKWSVRLIHLINLLASQNNVDIRMRMKQTGLFDLRDQLLLRFCRQPCSSSDRFVALSQLSLDAVASEAKFRSSDGILYILRWFICDEDHAQLRLLLVDVLRNRLGQHPETRKDLERALCDADVAQHLLESTLTDSEFVAWFFAEELCVQRQAILARLEKSLQIAEISARKQLEKVEERREKRIRSRLDALGKAAAASERDVQDVLEKSEIAVARFSKLLSTQMDLAASARRSRLELGASVYMNQCKGFSGVLNFTADEQSPRRLQSCRHCSITFQTEWDLICHLRLDHWPEDFHPAAAPLSAGDSSALVSPSA